jgi:hypothetical protein|tara:strand:- start:143 stop:415 length:273 start_codon:yes stop_codon:yes gene_type:complete
MAKDLVIYKNTKKSKIPKGDIFRKASKEQRFLGKTLPRMAWGAAKWAWRHPIASTALTLVPSAMRKIAGSQKGLKFPKYRQFDKRGRKII